MALWRKLGNGVASVSAFKQQRMSASDATDAPLIKNETKDPVKETKDPVKETKDPVKETKDPVEETKDPVKETKDQIKEPKDPVKETKDPVPQILRVEESSKNAANVIPSEQRQPSGDKTEKLLSHCRLIQFN